MATNKENPSPLQLDFSPDAFFADLTLDFLTLLQTRGAVKTPELKRLWDRLYSVAEEIDKIRSSEEFQQANHKQLRIHRKRFGYAKADLQSALKNLVQAKKTLRAELESLPPGYLNFDASERSLKHLHKGISRQESIVAALIHPSLRKETDKKLAKLAPRNVTVNWKCPS